jgi:hypothetical protein
VFRHDSGVVPDQAAGVVAVQMTAQQPDDFEQISP